MRLYNSSTGASSTGYYYGRVVVYTGNGPQAFWDNNTNAFWLFDVYGAASFLGSRCEVINPYETMNTTLHCDDTTASYGGSSVNAISQSDVCWHSANTSYTGLNIITAGVIDFTLSVYGYLQ
jgi:hypothetical protein